MDDKNLKTKELLEELKLTTFDKDKNTISLDKLQNLKNEYLEWNKEQRYFYLPTTLTTCLKSFEHHYGDEVKKTLEKVNNSRSQFKRTHIPVIE